MKRWRSINVRCPSGPRNKCRLPEVIRFRFRLCSVSLLASFSYMWFSINIFVLLTFPVGRIFVRFHRLLLSPHATPARYLYNSVNLCFPRLPLKFRKIKGELVEFRKNLANFPGNSATSLKAWCSKTSGRVTSAAGTPPRSPGPTAGPQLEPPSALLPRAFFYGYSLIDLSLLDPPPVKKC